MQVRGPNRVPASGGASRRTRARGAVSATAAAEPAAQVVLAGIPEAELTPKVRQALTTLFGEVQQLRRELEDSRARIGFLERLADEDPLAPIANRRAFVRELTRMVGFAQRYGAPASVIYFDINGMKKINDSHGHAAGDAVLLQVARTLLDNVRSSDVVGRLGGDEFGVILAQTDREPALHKAEALAAAIAATPVPWEGAELHVTAACGVHSFAKEEDATQAIEAADRAMYEDKRRHRDAAAD